eukprot:3937581-Rhodomonas_salina.4
MATDTMNVNNLTHSSSDGNTSLSGTLGEMATSSKTDPSLLHKVTTLQQENQELLQLRRELENRVQEQENKLKAVTESFEKERAELVEVQRKEMEQQFKAFMQDWISSMDQENPEVVSRMKTGIEKLIQE